MNQPFHPDDADRWLDEALHSYVHTEPLEGLEGRILQSVQRRAKRSWWKSWKLALAVAPAAVAIAGALFVMVQPRRPQLMAHVPVVDAPVILDQASSQAAPQSVDRHHDRTGRQDPRLNPTHRSAVPTRTVARVRPYPKAEVFPLPSRLSNEEQALLLLASSQAAKSALAELASMGQPPQDLPEIKPIAIRPLTLNDGSE